MYLRLPSSLHYPITINKYLKQVGDSVKRHDNLFLYSYNTKVKQGNRYDSEEVEIDKKFVQPFQSEFEGKIEGYFIWEGQVLSQAQRVCEIQEDCKHEVVFQGICANCGKDVSSEGIIERAPINITHDASSLTISKDEANRLDEDNKKRLLGARKLSLVVDLDQTIIHAAVDPTIAEWMKDSENPNHDAVKDVESFQLMDDGPGMRWCWYYIKQRPGLQDFLKQVSEIYELHIYTMGTRQYAKKVCEIIDKKGEFFKDRILSRDESGSMTAKNLSRLFPVDTKMVVIIDDRGDVWDYSPNLIRVKAFDFFQGIGDINSAFLPKQPEIVDPPQHEPVLGFPKDITTAETPNNGEHKSNGVAEEDDSAEKEDADTSAIEKLLAITGPDNPEVREMQSKGQEKIITSQIEEKPLEKMQREQDEKDEAEAAATTTQSPNGEPQASQTTESDSDSSESSESNKPKHRHAILKNDDEELIHLEESLRKVHGAFFKEYEKKRHSFKGGRVAKLSGGVKAPLPDEDDGTSPELNFVPDIKRVMPAMKQRVLGGVIMVYSGVLPLGIDVMGHDLTRWATSFGAQLVLKVTDEVTHVIATRVGTAKVNKARKMPKVKIVNHTWLLDSMQQWRKLDESRYFLEGLGKPKLASSENGELINPADITTQDLLLSDSEEDASGFDTGDERPNKRSKLDITVPDHQIEEEYDEYSPTSIADVDWASADAEVAEFMGSDAESGSDTESVASSLSYREKRASKRRRDDEDIDDGEGESKRSRGSYLNVVANTSSGRDSAKPARNPSEETIGREQQREEARERQQQAEEEDSDDELLKEFAEGLE